MSELEIEQEVLDVARSDGIFAGQFNDEAVRRAVRRGLIRLVYEGAAGLMGLAKIRVN